MEGSSVSSSDIKEVSFKICGTTDPGKETTDTHTKKNMEENIDGKVSKVITEGGNSDLNKDSKCADVVTEEMLLEDSNDEPKSDILSASEIKNLESVDAATEAKLLEDSNDNFTEAQAAVSGVVQLPQNKTVFVSGDGTDEKLWYSDDDTMEDENISSAIALLNDDTMEGPDATTDTKIMENTVEDKNTSSAVTFSDNKIDKENVNAAICETHLEDTIDAGNNAAALLPSLEEQLEASTSLVKEISSKNVLESKQNTSKSSATIVSDTLEENLLNAEGNINNNKVALITQDADFSDNTIVDTNDNSTNNKSLTKVQDIDIEEENLLNAELNFENQGISTTDVPIEEIDEEELLTDNQDVIKVINKPVNIDIIGQSIKAVLETGKSSLKCKSIGIKENPEENLDIAKNSDEANITSKDDSNSHKISLDVTSKQKSIVTIIDKTTEDDSKIIDNPENATEIDKQDNKSLIDNKQKDLRKSGMNNVVQDNSTDLENVTKTILDKTKDLENNVLNVDSSMDIDSSTSICIENAKPNESSDIVNISEANSEATPNIDEKQIGTEIYTNESIDIDAANIEENRTAKLDKNVSIAKADLTIEIDSSMDISASNSPMPIKSSHRLHMPDVMLEIPSQDLIDIDDVLDSPNDSRIDDFLDNSNNDSNSGEQHKEDKSNSRNNLLNIEIKAGSSTQEAQPSTSSAYKFTPDTFDDLPETSDSLGLLAESQRVQDDEDDDEGVHEDDDFEHDESSNQMTGEHSEDSNTHQSEIDPIRYEEEKETREELDDKVSNESEEDLDEFTEEQPNLDTLEIEEHTVATSDAEVGADEESVDCEENKSETVVDEVKDTQSSKSELKEADIRESTKNYDSSNLKPVIKENDESELSNQDLDKDKGMISKENNEATNDELIITEIDIVKAKDNDSERDTEKDSDNNLIRSEGKGEDSESKEDMQKSNDNASKETIDIEKDSPSNEELDKDKGEMLKESQLDDIKTYSRKVANVNNDESVISKKSEASDEDVVDQTPDIPTYNLSDSDNDDEPTAENIQNENKRKATDNEATLGTQWLNINKNIRYADGLAVEIRKAPTCKMNENVLSIVDLQETSSEEDTTEADKDELQQTDETHDLTKVTTVNLPTGIEVSSTGAIGTNALGIMKTQEKVVITRVRTPVSQKTVARLNTSEVTIKTTTAAEQTLVIPETQMQTGQAAVPTEPTCTPVYSIDSDEEEVKEPTEFKKKRRKCINSSCTSREAVFRTADNDIITYYDASRKRKPLVCQPCVDALIARKQSLIDGIRDMVPLSQLHMGVASVYPVEILDSDSEDEELPSQEEPVKEKIGEDAAKFLEENLVDILNNTWKQYKLEDRLKDAQDEINSKLEKIELKSKELNDMLSECQRMTDKLRTDLYTTFQPRIQSEPPILIYETPEFRYIGPELDSPAPPALPKSRLVNKRKMATNSAPAPAKRPSVIPLGYAPLNDPILKVQETKVVANNSDDDKDVSVVKLSAESPPPDLPPTGDLTRPPLRIDMPVYAMKNAFGPWLKGKITEIVPKETNSSNFTSCRVQFDHITRNNNSKILPARCIAYAEPPNVRMTIGTRLIALFKDSNKDSNKKDSFSSGVVAEAPTPVNNFRYLVFFDDGYAQYVKHPFTRLVCECSNVVWEEVHPFSRDFVKEYLMAFPERPMVRLHQGQNFKTEWNGKWWASRVVQVDASLVQVVFVENGRKEWIYRGSTRLAPLYVELQAAERHRTRALGTRRQPPRNNMPYVEYTRSEEQGTNKLLESLSNSTSMTLQQQKEELRKQRAVAKKSTTTPSTPAPSGPQPLATKPPAEVPDSLTSRVVYYTPKNAVRPYKLVPHNCTAKCKRSVLSLEDLRTYNPLAKPLLSGWERQIVRFKGQKEVMYRAPCGRRLRNMKELHRYLQATDSELSVDLFDFFCGTHCLAEFQIYKCLTGKKDLSQGRENVPIPCVNYYDHTLPEFCSYNTERTPTSGVPLNLDPEFLCGCDCTDDCEDKSKCACWQMTLEGARTIGMDTMNIGYEYKRLPEPLPSGIYECNSRCKCKQTCLNRVAQHPLQLKLQVFKTLNRGWGIRALNDVPKGAFLCIYAGNLLTDATANLDGLNEGDEYLAELDYIEVVEQMKEGYEADIPEEDKKLDKEQSESTKQDELQEQSSSSSEDEESASKYDKEDDDFKPGHNVAPEVSQFSKHLRKRSRDEDKGEKDKEKDKDTKDKEKNDDSFITISDDEEAREPSRFAAQPGMDGNEFMSKYKSVRSYFGEDEACYIMDAKVQGNIGRYLNHSCSPNVFVQNVFVDTHDPRFPWVAFFALSHIKAGTELTWNYNYDVGSVPDKVLYCYCQAPNCRGRLL